jgi:hypothetical protein
MMEGFEGFSSSEPSFHFFISSKPLTSASGGLSVPSLHPHDESYLLNSF